jgi:hypothetical protein
MIASAASLASYFAASQATPRPPIYIIKQTTAKHMMAQDPTALWIHLTPGHFTALQRNTQ